MLCKQPFTRKLTGINKRKIFTTPGYLTEVTPFPCGQCLHCRINQSRIWQTRLLLEAKMSVDSTFLTLTYDELHVPFNYYLVKEDLTLFLKRYRKRLGHKIRYYAVGEYGNETWRPHFHLAIFSEKRLERCIRSCEDMRKRDYCTQDCIAALSWNKGNISVTSKLSKELAGYITGYIKKKATRERRINRPNEYSTQSKGRRKYGTGGIGYGAIPEIANELKRYQTSGKSIIRAVSLGGRPKPLGGYLTSILSNQLGISESQIQSEFVGYASELVGEHFERGNIVPSILEESEGKRNSQTVKEKIYNPKRSL